MEIATHGDVVRIFPDIQDHTVLDILDAHATVDDLMAVRLILQGDGEEVLGRKRPESGLVNSLVDLLAKSQLQPPEDRER